MDVYKEQVENHKKVLKIHIDLIKDEIEDSRAVIVRSEKKLSLLEELLEFENVAMDLAIKSVEED